MQITSDHNDMFTLCFNNYERLRLREALTNALVYYENAANIMGNEPVAEQFNEVIATVTELLSDCFLPEQGMSNLTLFQYRVFMLAAHHELERADNAYDRTEYQKYADSLTEAMRIYTENYL